MISQEFSWVAFVILSFATVICVITFCRQASVLSEEAIGRGILPQSKVIWIGGSLFLQWLATLFFFNPITYVITMIVIIIMEWLTIRRPKKRVVDEETGEEELILADPTETLGRRFFAWFMFGLPVEAGLFMSTAYLADRSKTVEMNYKTVLLLLIPEITLVFVGFIRLVLSNDDYASFEEEEEEIPESEAGQDNDNVEDETGDTPEYLGSVNLGNDETAGESGQRGSTEPAA